MFDKLYEVPKSQAIGAVYYAVRIIKHKRNLQQVDPDLPPWIDTEPSVDEKRLAVELLQKIERLEQTPIRLLPKKKADEYICRLSDITDKRSIEGLTEADLKEGKRLLEKLRQDPIVWKYPAPGEKVSPPAEFQRTAATSPPPPK
jgi:hypothetical protein